MTSLLDLPAELLTQIFENLGGRELRRTVNNLTICRRWYETAHAIYLSGLDTSNIIVYGSNINDLSGRPSYTAEGQRQLMHKNTRTFYFRFLGHWWDEVSGKFLEENYDDPNALEYDLADRMEQDERPENFGSARCWEALRRWRKHDLIPRLTEVFTDLKHFTALEHVTFDASLYSQENAGPQWQYIYSSTVATLLRNLPLTHDLSSLTLDLCAGLDYDELDDAHVCDEVARILPRMETVRVRLKLICPSIFLLQDDVRASDVRLKTLIVKLHQPDLPSDFTYRSKCCTELQGSNDPTYLHEHIIRAAQQFLAKLADIRSQGAVAPGDKQAAAPLDHGMQLLRVSYTEISYPTIIAVDCLTMRRLCVNIEYFAYEDNGSPYWFETKDDILVGAGQFEFTKQSN